MTRDRMSYSPMVRELFEQLPRSGGLAPGAGSLVHGEAMELDRGAWVRFEARIEGGRILDCSFRAWGCPHVLAASALAARRLPGHDLEAGLPTDAHRLAAELAAPAEKLGRLLVVEDALRSMLERARGLQSDGQDPAGDDAPSWQSR